MSLEGAGGKAVRDSRSAATNYIWRRGAVMSWRTLFRNVIIVLTDSRCAVLQFRALWTSRNSRPNTLKTKLNSGSAPTHQ